MKKPKKLIFPPDNECVTCYNQAIEDYEAYHNWDIRTNYVRKDKMRKIIEDIEVVDTTNSGFYSPNAYIDKGAYMLKNQILRILGDK